MKKIKIWLKQYSIEILLLLLVAIICSIFLAYYGTFGADVDWLSQHSVFPDYFRRRFYQTGQIFPSLALQLGGGENIYRNSYYGLFSPVYLLSYLLPFVKMSDYVIASSMINIAVSVILMYRWLMSVDMGKKLSVWGACIYLFAAPILYHSYVHCMFVSYMPFLIFALFGVKRHLEKKKSGLLIISTFLMIMTSFYFSIGGMLALCLYAVYYYVAMQKDKIEWKALIAAGLRFVGCLLIAVFMSGVLLLPTAFALQGRGSEATESWSLLELLIPDITLKRFAYNANGLGLSSLVFVALFSGIFSKQVKNRVLNIGLALVLFIPIFGYLLNGGLYGKNKVFIPFIPIVIYAMVAYLREEVRREKHRIREGIPYVATVVLILYAILKKYEITELSNINESYILLESIVLLLGFLLYYILQKPWILVVPTLLFMMIFSVTFHLSNGAMTDGTFVEELTDRELNHIVEEIAKADEDWYRTEQLGNGKENAANLNRIHGDRQFVTSNYTSAYDKQYLDFRTKIFDLEMPFRNAVMEPASRNPIFQNMMGVRYVISKQNVTGWKKIDSEGDYGVYKNPYAAPVIYGVNHYLDEASYDTLSFPYNQIAFLRYAIVKDTTESAGTKGKLLEQEWNEQLTEETFIIKKETLGSGKLKKVTGGYEIETTENRTIRLPLKEAASEDTIYFLRFFVKNLNKYQDMKITLEGATNKVSDIRHEYYNKNTVFTYAVLVKEGETSVELTLGNGHYQILSASAYSGRMSSLMNKNLYKDAFCVDWKETKGDVIGGTLYASQDEKVLTSIPYDEGYQVYVDGKATETEIVNKAFLGFDITRGQHQITIEYRAKGLDVGRVISVIGVLLFMVVFWCEKHHK